MIGFENPDFIRENLMSSFFLPLWFEEEEEPWCLFFAPSTFMSPWLQSGAVVVVAATATAKNNDNYKKGTLKN